MVEEDEKKTLFPYQSGRRNLEVYVDDLVIKSHSEEEAVRDIKETFRTLRKINMKLNPKKCTFGAAEGMFLGHAISKSLNRKLASLNRFLSKATKKSLLFFKTLNRCIKKSDFAWTEGAEKALKDMKKQMADLPTLTALIEGEKTLIVYLSAAEEPLVPSYLQNGAICKYQSTSLEGHCNLRK
ncbi:reverse transcriptase domain-containing protein [Tanacetum coccineum]